MAYCQNNSCEYLEDGVCEYEGEINLDECGVCMTFRFRTKDDD